MNPNPMSVTVASLSPSSGRWREHTDVSDSGVVPMEAGDGDPSEGRAAASSVTICGVAYPS